MRFGVCAGLDKAEAAARGGWDFLEAGVGLFIPSEGDSAYSPVRARIARLPLPLEAANCFIPAHLPLTGPSVDDAAVRSYAEVALARMAEAGLRTVVLGSGGARNLPAGWPMERGLEQLASFLRAAAPMAERAGMTIALEPLRRAESNIINRVGEAAELCARVGHPTVRPLADLFHMMEEGEPPDALEPVAASLAHVHVADTGRVPPGLGTADFRAYFEVLAEGGYSGSISVECGWQDLDAQQAGALAALRAAWPEA